LFVGGEALRDGRLGGLGQFPGRALEVEKTSFQLTNYPLSLAGGDLDGDGLDDVVLLALAFAVTLDKEAIVVDVAGARGWAFLATQQAVELKLPELSEDDVPWPLRGLAMGDLDGDGKEDFAFTTIDGAGVFVLRGRGDGTFDQGFRLPRALGPIFAADLDGNGQLDLVGSSLGFNPFLWIRWSGGDWR